MAMALWTLFTFHFSMVLLQGDAPAMTDALLGLPRKRRPRAPLCPLCVTLERAGATKHVRQGKARVAVWLRRSAGQGSRRVVQSPPANQAPLPVSLPDMASRLHLIHLRPTSSPMSTSRLLFQLHQALFSCRSELQHLRAHSAGQHVAGSGVLFALHFTCLQLRDGMTLACCLPQTAG